MNLLKKYLFLAGLIIGISSFAMEEGNKRKLESNQEELVAQEPVAKKAKHEEENLTGLNDLPTELHLQIISELNTDPKSLSMLARTNKYFKNLITDQIIKQKEKELKDLITNLLEANKQKSNIANSIIHKANIDCIFGLNVYLDLISMVSLPSDLFELLIPIITTEDKSKLFPIINALNHLARYLNIKESEKLKIIAIRTILKNNLYKIMSKAEILDYFIARNEHLFDVFEESSNNDFSNIGYKDIFDFSDWS